jgi:hypothetical protein
MTASKAFAPGSLVGLFSAVSCHPSRINRLTSGICRIEVKESELIGGRKIWVFHSMGPHLAKWGNRLVAQLLGGYLE